MCSSLVYVIADWSVIINILVLQSDLMCAIKKLITHMNIECVATHSSESKTSMSKSSLI